jgi:predicted murein hydrolase (TIGR00659 family)
MTMAGDLSDVRALWVYLSASPLLHLTLTLVAFQAGLWLHQKTGGNPLANPVLIAVLLLVTILLLTGTSYSTYFEGAQFVHFLLGPATVALAIPLYRQFEAVRRSALAILVSIFAGSATAALSAIALASAMGASRDAILSLAPKSVTAPVAMAITRELGGLPSLTAALVILTGITGAMLGPLLLNAMNIRDWRARGLAIGTASHGIGTARAMQVNSVAGAFAGLAMGLNALATALILPILWKVIF